MRFAFQTALISDLHFSYLETMKIWIGSGKSARHAILKLAIPVISRQVCVSPVSMIQLTIKLMYLRTMNALKLLAQAIVLTAL